MRIRYFENYRCEARRQLDHLGYTTICASRIKENEPDESIFIEKISGFVLNAHWIEGGRGVNGRNIVIKRGPIFRADLNCDEKESIFRTELKLDNGWAGILAEVRLREECGPWD
jgi:hypothetical protein